MYKAIVASARAPGNAEGKIKNGKYTKADRNNLIYVQATIMHNTADKA